MNNKERNETLKEGGGKTADELFAEVQREAGMQAIEKVSDAHVNQILEIRQQFNVQDFDLLSDHVGQIQEIPAAIRQKITNFRTHVRNIVEKVATQIEDRKYKSTEEQLNNMTALSKGERTRSLQMVAAEKRLQVSFETLKITVSLLSEMNDSIIHKIEESEQRRDYRAERNLLLGNTILVYELTDYVLDQIEEFKLQGLEDLTAIQREELNKLNQQITRQSELRQRAQKMTTGMKDGTLASLDALDASLVQIKQEWEGYTATIQQMQNAVSNVLLVTDDLKIRRDVAKQQLDVFQAAAAVGILKSRLFALEDTVRGLENLKLVSLTPDRIIRLFRLDDGVGQMPPDSSKK